jgi:AcrR family transcriptional regulator
MAGGSKKRARRAGASPMREWIMDVAEAHLGEGGYLGVSLEEVAREVGVSKPALYYHFPDGKEELFVAIAHRALGQHREGLERAISSAGDGAGRLRAIARWLMSERSREHPMAELRNVGNFMNERHRAELAAAFFGSLYAPIHRVISSAVESGEFRKHNPEFLTWAFLSLLSGMLEVEEIPSGAPVPDTAATGETMPDATVDLFIKGVL